MEYDNLSLKCHDSEKLKKHVTLVGSIPFSQMQEEYSRANVFVMPSIRETTGSVVLEAMSYGLAVVAMNKFGAAVILDDKTGWLYDGTTKEEYINNLKDILVDCIKNPDKAIAHGKSARTAAEQYLWQIKLKEYISGSF